ncbi:hypothetical protein ACQUQU_09960 [Thalassolituus sp. LLYu03]|uniref:hypothetical protein n=1 Tax=Thalassolituus sp. LLYu03 TaxID=3421656 RepID=UPI003D2A1F2E
MNKLILLVFSALTLTGCFGTDDSSTPATTSDETCDDVSLGQARRDAAFLAALNVNLSHNQALGVWKFVVSDGQPLTVTMDVPDDKDYQMALFDTNGNKLACSDNAGLGVGEQMEYEVDNLTMVWLKIWTSESPSSSVAVARISTPVISVPVDVSELEPNDTPATAQEIGVAHSLIAGSVDYDDSDADDYFVVSVTEGDVVTVTGEADSGFTGLLYVSVTDDESNVLSEGENELTHEFTSEALSASLTYTVPASVSEVFVWIAGVLGAADYEVEIQVQSPE